MFSPPPFPGWAIQAFTGDAETDSKHRLLFNAMARFRQTCTELEHRKDCIGCPADRNTTCTQELIDTLGDLLAFLVDHFFLEEQAMRQLGLTDAECELCRLHKEDHAEISDTVLRIVSGLDKSQTVTLLRQLDSVLQTWMKRHMELHDATLLKLLRNPL